MNLQGFKRNTIKIEKRINYLILLASKWWAGVQRVLKFCKYLSGFGWNPIVLTVENGEYPAIDNSLLKDSTNIECIKVKRFLFIRYIQKIIR